MGRSKSFNDINSLDMGRLGKALLARHAGFNLWIVLFKQFSMNPVDFFMMFLTLCLITNNIVAKYILLKENKKTNLNHTDKGWKMKVSKIIEDNNLNIIAQKRIKLSREKAEGFYAIHREKPFFNELIEYMTSGPVIVQVLEGDNAVENYRKIMGSTNPKNAEEGTIRKQFALSIEANSVHGSASSETAIEEIKYFFDESEII